MLQVARDWALGTVLPAGAPLEGIEIMQPRHPDLRHRWFPESGARRVTLIYLIVGLAWVTISDWLFDLVARDTSWSFVGSIGKAWLFVGVTSLLLYVAVARLQARNRQSARLLVESEDAYRAMFANNPAPMWVYDAATLEFLAVNDAALARYGYSRGQFLRMTLFDLHPPEQHSRLKRILASASGQTLHGTTGRHRTCAGEEIDVEITSHAILFTGVAARLVLAQDVTDRLQAERALAESERRYRQLVEAMPDGLLVHDGAAIRFANAATARLAGLERAEQIHGQPVWRIFPGAALPKPTAAGVALQPRLLRRADGSVIEVEISSQPVTLDGERCAQVVVRDVQLQQRMQRQLKQANDRLSRLSSQVLETAEQERRHLARELHDDVGQLLTFAKMTSSWLLRQPLPEPGRQRAAALPAVIGEALDKVRDLALLLRPAQLDRHGLSAAMRAHLERYLAGMAIDWALSGGEGSPRPDATVEIALFRIFQEAVTNVIKHSGASHLWVGLQPDGGQLRLIVRDDGCGFDVDEGVRQGSSLGLLTMRERAHLVSGTLTVISRAGAGTEIVAAVPCTSPAAPTESRREQQHG
jgi:PAS domain S-box-containing protein